MSQQVHAAGGLLVAPELAIRELLLVGLQDLAGDRTRLDELFARTDELLNQGTAGRWVDEIVDGYLRMQEDHGGDGVRVLVGPPSFDDPLHWPAVSVVMEGTAEDEGHAVIGDIQTVTTARVGQEIEKRETIGIDHVTTIQVQCWAAAPEEALVLHSVVHHLLMREKSMLESAGVDQVTLSSGHVRPDPQYHPQHTMVPVITCRLRHQVAHTRRTRPAPATVSVTIDSFEMGSR